MRFELLGPERAAQRMQELRARVEAALPKPAEFQQALNQATASTPTGLAGNLPFNPFGSGVEIASDAKVGGLPTSPGHAFKDAISQAATEAGIAPALLDALVAQESNYDPNARSRAGAMGLTQLMPDTAAALGVQNPFNPIENLRGGARYLASLLKRFGDPALALAAYNAGPGRVERAGNQIPNIAETQNYVKRVLARFAESEG